MKAGGYVAGDTVLVSGKKGKVRRPTKSAHRDRQPHTRVPRTPPLPP